MITGQWRTATLKRTTNAQRTPVDAAQQIINDLLALREELKASAEGFAVLDFVNGHVATELPMSLARDLVDVLRGRQPDGSSSAADDLVIYWLENYRRAYSHMIMRVLEDGADSLTV